MGGCTWFHLGGLQVNKQVLHGGRVYTGRNASMKWLSFGSCAGGYLGGCTGLYVGGCLAMPSYNLLKRSG